MPKTEHGLFDVLEDELKKASQPLDCQTLFDRTAVRKHAASVNRVSDYLGHMWRKGLVTRLPSPRIEGTRARWMYMWKGREAPVLPTVEDAVPPYAGSGRLLVDRPEVKISEDGGKIVIDLPQITLTIKVR